MVPRQGPSLINSRDTLSRHSRHACSSPSPPQHTRVVCRRRGDLSDASVTRVLVVWSPRAATRGVLHHKLARHRSPYHTTLFTSTPPASGQGYNALRAAGAPHHNGWYTPMHALSLTTPHTAHCYRAATTCVSRAAQPCRKNEPGSRLVLRRPSGLRVRPPGWTDNSMHATHEQTALSPFQQLQRKRKKQFALPTVHTRTQIGRLAYTAML